MREKEKCYLKCTGSNRAKLTFIRNLNYRDTTLIKISARKNVSIKEIKLLKLISL